MSPFHRRGRTVDWLGENVYIGLGEIPSYEKPFREAPFLLLVPSIVYENFIYLAGPQHKCPGKAAVVSYSAISDCKGL